MEIIIQLLHALWNQDFTTLADPSMTSVLYFLFFIILFLENSLLPAAFLPGDSLLILVGILCAKDTLVFHNTLILLTIATSLGCWISYIQGYWLSNTCIMRNWFLHLPSHYHKRARRLFHRHGLFALLIGRFIAFVRTLLPIIAGLSGLNSTRFQIFNWISSLLWVFVLMTIGFLLGKTSIFIEYEDKIIFFLMLLPLLLLIFGLISSLFILWKRKYSIKNNTIKK